MPKQRFYWLVGLLLLVVAAFVVPFTLLRDTGKIYGAFLFWCLFALVAMGGIYIITRRWGE